MCSRNVDLMRMKLTGCVAAFAAGCLMAAPGADVDIDFGNTTGPMLPLHGVCNSPLMTKGVQESFRDAGIPFMRPHDACGAFGGAHYIDIPNLFPDFSKDENDPASYDFNLTDAYLGTIVAAGTEVFYRLGVTFEPQTKFIKPYNVFPPPDFAKWARICEHVIRHYTEGWADGKKWNIRYWEIWNEPETTSGWMGRREQFFEFYRIASNHLKAKFPHLKIGGYAASGFYAAVGSGKVTPGRLGYLDFFTNFIAYAQAPATKCPLDFFSWHIYTLDPEDVAAQAKWCRSYLDTHGFAGVETVLNEWNRIDHQDPKGRIRYYDEMKEAPGAAFAAAVFCLLQRDRTVSKAMYYDAFPQRVYCGLYYFPSQRTTPCWETFRKFNVLYRLGTAVHTESHLPGLYACAATDGRKKAILLVNTGVARMVTVAGVGNVWMSANAVELIER